MWKSIKKNKLTLFSFYLILFFGGVALFADFISNEKPIVAKYKGKFYFPVLKQYAVDLGIARWNDEFQNADWKKINYDFSIFPPVPYLANNLDSKNAQSVSPLEKQNVSSVRWKHFLGTDELGRDVLAGMIQGTRVAFIIGIFSMVIASIIGLILGSMAGYFGDEKFKISRGRLWLNIVFLFFAVFYSFGVRTYTLEDAAALSMVTLLGQLLLSLIIFSMIMTTANLLAGQLKKVNYFQKKITIPVDLIISRGIEIFVSIPILFLILSFISIVKPSIFIVIIIIGFTAWTSIARFVRAELLSIRNREYIESAKSLGLSDIQILIRHALPNAISPAMIVIAFGIASAILTESSLSFLGVGLPADTVSWGSLLASARKNPNAWWLTIFPGLAIFVTVTVFNLLGEGLNELLEPRRKKT